MKSVLKLLLKKLPIAITKNQQYDRDTLAIIKKVCKPHSNCIDIGCHKGEILEIICKHAPKGHHHAFEPIPILFENLKKTLRDTDCQIHNIALSNAKGNTQFNYVKSNPAYSGLIKRKYDKKNEEDETINVQTDLLDNIISENEKIDFIKIDVEGGELGVLQGGIKTIQRCKPIIIFEHGLGAADCYHTTPKDIFNLLNTTCGMQISTMSDWLKGGRNGFTLAEFEAQFYQKKNYYFIAFA